MAYIRPCNKCGQRISMREMRAGQWVAFDASTQTPHKCGKKTKADPNIKKLAKERVKEKISEGVDLGYSDIEVQNPTPDKVEEINSKIEEVYYESEIDKEIEVLEDRLEDIKKEQEIKFKKKEEPKDNSFKDSSIKSEDKPLFGTPGSLSYYFWRGLVIFWIIMFLNGILFGPFD